LPPPELHLLTPTCTKSSFAPDPTGGAYIAPPGLLAVFRGPISKGSKGRGREDKRRERRGRRGEGKEGERT